MTFQLKLHKKDQAVQRGSWKERVNIGLVFVRESVRLENYKKDIVGPEISSRHHIYAQLFIPQFAAEQ